MAKQEIAKFNEDYDETCNYCKEAASTVMHIRWQCKHFGPHSTELDPGLAAVLLKYLQQCIQCGIAPAMKVEGERTYWGMVVDEDEDVNTKQLLGVDMKLHTPGDDAEKTAKREEAIEIVQDPLRNLRNSKQPCSCISKPMEAELTWFSQKPNK